jgi:hypothetical protein
MCYNKNSNPDDEQFEQDKEDLLEELRNEEKEELLTNPNLPKEDIDFLIDNFTVINPNMETVLEIVKNKKSYSTKRRKTDDLIDEGDDYNLAELTLDNYMTLILMENKSTKSFIKSYRKTEEYKNYKKK